MAGFLKCRNPVRVSRQHFQTANVTRRPSSRRTPKELERSWLSHSPIVYPHFTSPPSSPYFFFCAAESRSTWTTWLRDMVSTFGSFFLFVLVVVFVHLVFVVVFCFVLFFLWLSKIVLTKSTRKNSTMNNTKGACENVVGIVYCVEHVFSEKLPIRPIGPSLRLQRLCEKQVPQRPTK